jgi:hypothetical protein
VVGFFDSIDQMHEVYDRYAGHTGLTVDKQGWKLTAAETGDADQANAQ